MEREDRTKAVRSPAVAARQTGHVRRRGRVFVAPVPVAPGLSAADAKAPVGVPPLSAFWASWEVEDAGGETAYFRTVEDAIAWGRERSRVVLVRLGSGADETYFSAGDAPGFRTEGTPMPVWPPDRE
jgi:hypothetical protein